jgi:glycosyltransferase involved in cell wall biosynthesis
MNASSSPIISIVVATFNAAATLEKCITTIISQDFPAKELLIIDGGSTDGTADIIRQYAGHIAHWASEPDRGIADAWNKGVERAGGKWLLFLGADDYLINNRVLSSIAPELDPTFDVVYGKLRLEGGPYHGSIIGGDWDPIRFRRRMTIPNPAAFINRALITEIGGFNERFRIALDYEFFLRKSTLRARFCPLDITVMLCGGVSFRNRVRSLQESRCAQIMHGVDPFIAHVWYLLYRIKALVR